MESDRSTSDWIRHQRQHSWPEVGAAGQIFGATLTERMEPDRRSIGNFEAPAALQIGFYDGAGRIDAACPATKEHISRPAALLCRPWRGSGRVTGPVRPCVARKVVDRRGEGHPAGYHQPADYVAVRPAAEAVIVVFVNREAGCFLVVEWA
jgi:hypothetical protein